MDRVYMTFVQATTGSGGWPMSVWLTPALQPFYGGTYFPPTSRWGRPGFVEILDELARAWREERDKRRAVGRRRSSSGCAASGRRQAADAVPGPDALDAAVAEFAAAFDRAPRRLRQRAEVPAAERAAVPAARARPHGRGRAARHGAADAAGDGARRHARPPRRRLPPLLAWTATGACRTSRRCSTTRRSWCWPTSRPRRLTGDRVLRRRGRRHARLRAARPHRSGRRLLLGRGRRQRAARACRRRQRPQDGGRVLHLGDAEVRAAARRRRRAVLPALRRAGRTATRRSIRRTSSPARTCCTPRGRSRTSRRALGRSVADVRGGAARAAAACCSTRAARPSAAAPRRQGADGLERPDDGGLRPGRPRAAARRGLRWRTPQRAARVHPRRTCGTPPPDAAAPLSPRRRAASRAMPRTTRT